jgi:HK97 family phage major capsid protein
MTEVLSFASTIEVEGRRLRGSVQLAGQQTRRNGELVEVDPAALVKADASAAVLTAGHQAGADMSLGYDPLRTFARVDNGSLVITRTEQGFTYETPDDLPNTTYANDLLELARAKVLGGTSFDVVGLRSTFSTATDGTRVRRYTSIAALTAIAPVIEPAFPSTVAAFSKESDVTDKETPEPPKQPDPEPEPAKFAEQPKSGVDEWAATAEAFSNEQIEATMEQVFSAAKGELTGELLDRYEGFARVLAARKKADADTRRRIERMTILHNLNLGRVPQAPEAGLYESDDYKAAFTRYLRTGDKALMEQFAQSIAGSGAEGGYTVPDGFLDRVTTRLKAFGGIAGVADEITTTTGESLRWPSNDDTSNTAAIAAEGVAGTVGADLVFGSIELGAFSYDANGAGNVPLKVSLELIQDAAFDIAAFVGDRLGERIGRKQAVDLATGAGGTAPVGLLTKSADTMTATVASLAASEHIFQVDSAYRDLGNCRFVMSDTTLVKFWQAQASGVPIFIPGGATIGGAPHGTLYGFPITIDAAAGNLVAFGDIRRGYIVRRVRGVQLLVDPYTAQGTRQIAYHAWARMDANIQDSFAYSVSSYSGVSADT